MPTNYLSQQLRRAIALALMLALALPILGALATTTAAAPADTCIPVLGQHDVSGDFTTTCADEPGQVRAFDFAISAPFGATAKAEVRFRSTGAMTILNNPNDTAGNVIPANTWSEPPTLKNVPTWNQQNSGKAIRVIPTAAVELKITSSKATYTVKMVPVTTAPAAVASPTAAPTGAAQLSNAGDVFNVPFTDAATPIDKLVLRHGDKLDYIITATGGFTLTVSSSTPANPFVFEGATSASTLISQDVNGSNVITTTAATGAFTVQADVARKTKLSLSIQAAKGQSGTITVTVTHPQPAATAQGSAAPLPQVGFEDSAIAQLDLGAATKDTAQQATSAPAATSAPPAQPAQKDEPAAATPNNTARNVGGGGAVVILLLLLLSQQQRRRGRRVNS